MHQTGAMRENDIGGRCEDKESGEEQKGNGANMEAAFVRGMKKKTEGGCRPPLPLNVCFVTSDLMLDHSTIGRLPRHSRPQLHEPLMLYTKVSPPPIQSAINRGRGA